VDAQDHMGRAEWRKSTYSANGSTCVEVARNLPGIIAVRDSKDPEGPALAFAPAQWEAFTVGIRRGKLTVR
jgi:hypothetical protein